MTYRLVRPVRGWPNKDYTFGEIKTLARRQGRTIRDGYGRLRIRHARKLIVSGGVVLVAVDEPHVTKSFGPRTDPT